MEQTPIAFRKHVAIFGDTNAGKSVLFNSIIGQETVIVSEHKGTTTDPVIKAMELLPFGPIALIDTAGLNDLGEVGMLRIKKTKAILHRTDLAIYAADITSFEQKAYEEMVVQFEKKSIPHILVLTKCDKVSQRFKEVYQEKYQNAVFTAYDDLDSMDRLKGIISRKLEQLEKKGEGLIGDLLPPNSTVVLVVPVDSEAPKGRLILPQVQLIRDCLDHGIKCFVTRETELSSALEDLQKVDLVVTDSQAFKIVSEIVPRDTPLTSFSMLLARQKGDLETFIQGVKKLEALSDQGKILIAEGCSHNHTHEDIGRIKIPALIKKHTGKEISFTFYAGHDFPEKLADYQMVVHCGACMLNRKTVNSRLAMCRDLGIPMTNYGVLLAYLNGILPRCSEIFDRHPGESESRLDD